jgi:UDP-glucose 4-epimerase
MRILVAGVGFIGSHVVDYLIRSGHEVSILDRYPRLDTYSTGARVILGDIRDRTLVKEAVIQQDGVINLAGILGTMETVADPYPSVETNIVGALNVFEGCRPSASNPRGVPGVHISVGNHFMHNTYAITKAAAERFALMYNKEHGSKIAVVRALNAYGEGQKHRPVRKMIPSFIVAAFQRRPIQIYGDGRQIMDMIYVKDVADILARALLCDHGHYETVFEAGTGRRTTVLEIATMINSCTGNQAGVEHLPMRPGEPERSVVVADPCTLSPLGVSTNDLIPLENGIERTVRWYTDHYDWRSSA